MKCFNLLSQNVKGVQEVDVDVQEGLPNLGGQRHLEVGLGNLDDHRGVEDVVDWWLRKIQKKGRFSTKNKYRYI
jgi:hypothetical protein